MSYNSDDDYDKQYEEEEILYVDGGLPRDEDDEFYFPSYREYIKYYCPMVKKYLTNMIEACENMPRYQEYLALGKMICAYIYFK